MYALPFIVFMRLHRAALDARRKDRTWKFLGWSAVSGVIAALLIGCLLFATVVLFATGLWWLAIPLVALFAIPVAGSLITRHALVPLGLYKTAFWVGHFTSIEDSDAMALVFAAWALSHRPSTAGEVWIAARRDRRRPLGDAEVVTTALLASARGDAAGARQLMRSTLDLVEVHPAVRELAGEWLACDDAERGAWHELAADAAAARFPATALTFLLEGVAAQRTAAPSAPSAVALYARWIFAPHRRATAQWLAPAPAAAVQRVETVVETGEPAPERAPLPRAVAAHLHLARKATAGELADAVGAWDAALADAATRTWIARRALELDAPLGAAERALVDVTRAVTDELATIADGAKLGAPSGRGRVGGELARRLRHGRLDALEQGFSRWEARSTSGQALPPIDEWREWIALRAQYDAAVTAGGLDLRRLAFPHAYKMGNSMSAWLWNTRNEYALSHAIFTWLLGEALAVGDTEAIDMLTRNSRLAVSTRTGRVEFPNS
ncbi:MAG: hypothetical protein ABI467_05220 [Kofleriaceae bacterium]